MYVDRAAPVSCWMAPGGDRSLAPGQRAAGTWIGSKWGVVGRDLQKALLYSRGNGHQELVGPAEQHKRAIAEPDVVGVHHEADEPRLKTRDTRNHQLRPQGPADLQEAGSEGRGGP